MWKLSQAALIKNSAKKNNKTIIIGYFSGSISHDPDIKMIEPTLKKILKKYKNVKLLLSGEITPLNFSDELSSQIIYNKFKDWEKLPKTYFQKLLLVLILI